MARLLQKNRLILNCGFFMEDKKQNMSTELMEKEEKFEKDLLDQLLRVQAEFDNYRKRIQREQETLYSTLKGKIILNLLPVLDDLDRMVQHTQHLDDPLANGIELIYQKMKTILRNEGLEEINPVGKPFDPLLHEAIETIETDEEKEGLVLEEWEKGYLLDGKLLRASRVRVGRKNFASCEEKEK